jgi:Domain of unknown function (DUF4352)
MCPRQSYPQVPGTCREGIGLLFVNICPKCGRRYPSSFRNCLECGTRLVSNRDGDRKKRAVSLVRKVGIISLMGGSLFCAFLFVIPVLHLSMETGQDFSTIINTVQSPKGPPVPEFTLNQTVSSPDLAVTVVRTREGNNLLNADRFFFITVNLQNLQKDTPLRASGSDFILIDAEGHSYYTYGLGNSIEQDLPPQSDKSYELEYEIPRNAAGLVLAVYFPRATPESATEPPALFAVS